MLFRAERMCTIREYIREVMLEIRFADITSGKNQWLDIPAEKLAQRDPNVDLSDEIFDLVKIAYADLPGGNLKVKSADDLPGGYTFFDAIDVDDDPEPDAVVFGKSRGGNLKIGGIGHDGQAGKRISVSRMLELVKQPGVFAEVSGRMADIAIAAGVPVVTDPSVAKNLVKRDMTWVGKHPSKNYGPGTDGWYSRGYGGGASHLKIIVGNV